MSKDELAFIVAAALRFMALLGVLIFIRNAALPPWAIVPVAVGSAFTLTLAARIDRHD